MRSRLHAILRGISRLIQPRQDNDAEERLVQWRAHFDDPHHDAKALRRDWDAAGREIRAAMKRIDEEIKS